MTETKLRVHAEVEAKQRRDLFQAGQRLHRMLGPWTKKAMWWIRYDVLEKGIVTLSEAEKGGRFVVTGPAVLYEVLACGIKKGSTLDEAKNEVDQALTEAGWELVD